MRRRVLDAVQLWRISGCLGDDVEPELVVEVAGFLPLVGREADGPRAGTGLSSPFSLLFHRSQQFLEPFEYPARVSAAAHRFQI